MTYNNCLLKLVKESFLPLSSNKTIKNITKTQLLYNLDNIHVQSVLVLPCNTNSFNQGLNQAIILYESLKLVIQSNNSITTKTKFSTQHF